MDDRDDLRGPIYAPFPWFGGKRRVADVVWRALGADCPNYVEPFAGSLAVLLGRPGGPGKIETVNDRDCFVSNFWRAVTADPYAVADWCDWPVNEADLHARHAWLVSELETHRARMHSDADYYDEKIAGWWVWGLCQWIGGGWCVEPQNQKHPKLDGIGKGVHSQQGHPKARMSRAQPRPDMRGDSAGTNLSQQLPNLRVTDGASGSGVHASGATHHWKSRPAMSGDIPGNGVHSDRAHARGAPQPHWEKRPDLHSIGKGVHAQSGWNERPDLGRRPDLTNGHGVHSHFWLNRRPNLSGYQSVHLPSLGNDRGINGLDAPPCFDWFVGLMRRLRRVRVACGDWRRVLGPSVLGKGKNVGGRRPCAVFLDPPYSHELREPGLYAEDDGSVAELARDWAIEHGDDPDLRIALCGYEGEHEMPEGWKTFRWTAARGYAGENNTNRERERIWFSRHCNAVDRQLELFEARR